MAVRVFFHIGVPKSGTTFLQTTLWRHAAQLRQEGVLLPGEGHRDHRWASLMVREDPKLANRAPEAREAWDRILSDVHTWAGTAVISHEFFATASKRQADRAVAALAPAEVHLVVTARDPLGLLTPSWQETLKYRGVQPLDGFHRHVSSSPHDMWTWRGLDAAEVLDRWAVHVPPDRVHIVPMPPLGRDRRLLWDRFAGLFSVDSRQYDVSGASCNRSLGLVQCELLRQLSPSLGRYPTALARSRWIRGYLAEEKLGACAHERFLPGPARVQECRQRARRMVRRLQEGGFHVVGDVEELLVPAILPNLRTPADVTSEELRAAAADLVAALLDDVRETHRRLGEAEQRSTDGLRLLARLRSGVARAYRAVHKPLEERGSPVGAGRPAVSGNGSALFPANPGVWHRGADWRAGNSGEDTIHVASRS